MRIRAKRLSIPLSFGLAAGIAGVLIAADAGSGKSGQSPIVFSGHQEQTPGVFHKITVSDLPKPYASESVDNGPDHLIPRPANAWPKTVPGFTVKLFAGGLQDPRLIRTAPNGDLFDAESEPHRGEPGAIKVFR